MSTITRYVVSPTPESWSDATHEYDTYRDALDVAIETCGCVTELTYTFDDSLLIDDFREMAEEDEEEEEGEEDAEEDDE